MMKTWKAINTSYDHTIDHINPAVVATYFQHRTNANIFVTFKFQISNILQNQVSKADLTCFYLNTQLNCNLPEISSRFLK